MTNAEYLRQCLDERGITPTECSRLMRLSVSVASHILNGYCRVTPRTAKRLEHVLAVPARTWLARQAEEDRIARQQRPHCGLPNCIKPTELAKSLRVNVASVYSWLNRGLVRAYRCDSNHHHIPSSEVARLRRCPPQSAPTFIACRCGTQVLIPGGKGRWRKRCAECRIADVRAKRHREYLRAKTLGQHTTPTVNPQ